ncbi:efflux RND transporter periplasmic adaptor subunit [Billgrantia pellis]|uniref:Efflux RND transporter periplasmic adaptor subunit n=1 Tax=Billgrantia pellis TaxID=2606936 RepID=A0A7V7G0P6_9GAMM|nr:efflux RND transporter periplasmic adaptor subunit [Halomonas pellis]KAA0012976.1 efflux RND transporter periplasmic adaptor subunit [Halomonas pellis]
MKIRCINGLAVFVAAIFLVGCGADVAGQDTAAHEEPPQVEALEVSAEPFTPAIELPGRVEPVRMAEIRARVAGIVISREFVEGSDVRAGDILFQIDPAPLNAAVSRAQAQLARADAMSVDAKTRLTRFEPLVEIEAVSRQDYDSARAAVQSAEADKRAAQAELETALLDLSYATVEAPIDGRVGRALVTEGAMVGQNEATPLAMIQQLDPVYVDFKLPVSEVARLRAAHARAEEDGDPRSGVRVSLTSEVDGEKREGQLMFSDVTVDRGTGQVTLRGAFPNEDGSLLPGMYVRVSLIYGTDSEAILVPQRAVRIQDDGATHVLVVDDENRLEERAVETGAMKDSRWHVTSGLVAGDRVVVGGMSNPAVAPGSSVEVLEQKPTSP